MNETPRDPHLHGRRALGRSGRAGDRRTRTFALVAPVLLTFGALFGGAAAADPAARQDTASGLAQAPVAALKEEYLRCDRVSARQRLALQAAIYCSAISEELLKREFHGDFDLLLAWWRAARQAPAADDPTPGREAA